MTSLSVDINYYAERGILFHGMMGDLSMHGIYECFSKVAKELVKAMSSATGGNLYQAQNQAAGSGSSAVQIFRNPLDLQEIQESHCRNGPAGYDDSELTDLNDDASRDFLRLC